MRASLLESGVVFDPAAAAIKAAAAAFPVADPPLAYLGRLTATTLHTGDDSSPLEFDRVVAYGIRLTGLSLPPFGGHRTNVDPSLLHTEMVVFVDAQSAQLLFATDYR